MRSEGNASVTVLILVMALAAIFLSAAAFSGALAKLVMGFSGQDAEKEKLAEEVRTVIDFMCDDPTPAADSSLDPVWTEIALPSASGVSLTLKDLSSRINPNSALDYLLNSVNAYAPGKLYEEFHKFRMEKGPLTDVNRSCADYFNEKIFDKFFTEYSFFNINTANEGMLYVLYEARTGKKATSTSFASKVRNRRTNKEYFAPQDLKALLTAEEDNVYPFISAFPELNVNLVDSDLLGAVLAMGRNIFKIELNGSPKDVILSMRAGTEITAETLAALIKPKFKNTILESYLGCRTWFWEITAARGSFVYRAVIVRLPPAVGEKEKTPRFRLIEERWERVAGPETGAPGETETTHE